MTEDQVNFLVTVAISALLVLGWQVVVWVRAWRGDEASAGSGRDDHE